MACGRDKAGWQNIIERNQSFLVVGKGCLKYCLSHRIDIYKISLLIAFKFWHEEDGSYARKLLWVG